MLLRSIGFVLVLAFAIVGCDGGGGSGAEPYPEACASFDLSERRCAAMVDEARATAAGRLTGEPVSIGLLPPQVGEASLGGGQVLRVVFALANGTQVIEPVMCIGIPNGPDDASCWEPFIGIQTTVSHDVPCTGEPPAGCPAPIVPDAAALAAARPLQLATLDVPIDRVGHHEVKVGDVGLPNGYVTTLQAALAEDRPTDFWIDGYVRLELRPSDPSRPPFGNVYERPIVEGVEDATVWLVFEVTEVSPGAVLHVVDVDVR